jgi:hypothetical protein
MPQLPTEISFRKMCQADPMVSAIAPLGQLRPGLPARTLFHAGPPFQSLSTIPKAVLNAAAAAALHEGFAADLDAAKAAIHAADIELCPAQDFGIVTPLAFVAGPSMYGVAVVDAHHPQTGIVSPLNDGPPQAALRFGVDTPAGRAALRRLTDQIGPDLAANLKPSVRMLPILSDAIDHGDDLHGQVTAAQAAVSNMFEHTLATDSQDYISAASQFVLNFIMATAGVMLAAGSDVPDSQMIVACGGNGQRVGYKIAANPSHWITVPAARPVGPKFREDAGLPLPAIGDSAVIDALGFGAACLRFAPDLGSGLRQWVDEKFFTVAAHAPFMGAHPTFKQAGLRLGLDAGQATSELGIMLGMVAENGMDGLIGRGVAPWHISEAP